MGGREDVSQGVCEGGEMGREGEEERRGKVTDAVLDDMLVAGIVIDIYCDAAEGGDFGGELIEAGIVLSGLRG